MPKATDLARLKANPSNPRLAWQQEQAATFRKSLVHFGDLAGIVLNRRTGQLVGGHKRVEDFRSDPKASVVVTEKLRTPDASGTVAFGHCIAHGTRWSYREVDWPADKEAAANLAANKWSSEWDTGQLTEMLKGLEADDRLLTGFAPDEFAELLKAMPAAPPAAATEPQAAAAPTPATAGAGAGTCPTCGAHWDGHKRKPVPEAKRQFALARARWRTMIARCTDPKCKDYKWYGARGITVDQRWLEFKVFMEDMGPMPAGMTLERKDNNVGYCKTNCCWATRQEQNVNRRKPTK